MFCLIQLYIRTMPEGECVYIRQSMSVCVITNMLFGTLKICPSLKENVQLVYIVTDADYDSGKFD